MYIHHRHSGSVSMSFSILPASNVATMNTDEGGQPRAPVMFFRHPAGPAAPVAPLVMWTPPPSSGVVMSLLHAFAVSGAPSGPLGAAAPTRASKRGNASEGDDEKDKQAKKQKKPSYVTRREEREELEREIQELEARAKQLRDACANQEDDSRVSRLENMRMRDAVDEQRCVMASVQSVMTEFTNGQVLTPLSDFIHLTTDPEQRREALLAVRSHKLERARRFLAARTRHMTPGRETWEESRYRTPDGDYCGVRLDVTTYLGTTAKKVLDALVFYAMHAEIGMTELTGNLTVSENEESIFDDQTGVILHRMVTTTRGGLLAEKNAAMFIDSSRKDDSSDEYAFVTSDFIDQDDIYPYVPTERVQKDFLVAIKIATYPLVGESKDKQMVVLTRWMFQRLHAPRLVSRQVTKHEMEALQQEQLQGMDALTHSIRLTVDAARRAG